MESLSHRFASRARTLETVRDIDLDIRSGEIVSIIGPNGCGKSTLLRLMSGLLRPAAGAVRIGGDEVRGPHPRVGLVFQEPRLLPWRSAAGNVALPLEFAGWPERRRQERVAELLSLVGLTAFADTRPHALSGGMRQRLAVARSLALDPAVLLLDEPFSALDALTRERLNLELLRLAERTRTTTVVVTHSIPEAVFLADRVLVMSPRPGHIVADIAVPLPRPRRLDALDSPELAATAAAVRARLVLPADTAAELPPSGAAIGVPIGTAGR